MQEFLLEIICSWDTIFGQSEKSNCKRKHLVSVAWTVGNYSQFLTVRGSWGSEGEGEEETAGERSRRKLGIGDTRKGRTFLKCQAGTEAWTLILLLGVHFGFCPASVHFVTHCSKCSSSYVIESHCSRGKKKKKKKDVPSTLFPQSILVSLWWSLTPETVETASRSFQAFMRYSYEAFAVGTWMKSGSSCLRFLPRGCLVDFCIWATGTAGLVSISAVSHELCSGR